MTEHLKKEETSTSSRRDADTLEQNARAADATKNSLKIDRLDHITFKIEAEHL